MCDFPSFSASNDKRICTIVPVTCIHLILGSFEAYIVAFSFRRREARREKRRWPEVAVLELDHTSHPRSVVTLKSSLQRLRRLRRLRRPRRPTTTCPLGTPVDTSFDQGQRTHLPLSCLLSSPSWPSDRQPSRLRRLTRKATSVAALLPYDTLREHAPEGAHKRQPWRTIAKLLWARLLLKLSPSRARTLQNASSNSGTLSRYALSLPPGNLARTYN